LSSMQQLGLITQQRVRWLDEARNTDNTLDASFAYGSQIRVCVYSVSVL
jgi:hypothetical protein